MCALIQAVTDTLPKQPTVLSGFEHIKHYWDYKHHLYAARIMPGEFFVSSDKVVIATVLGSCVSACIRDPVAGIGGMNHFMLPEEESRISDDSYSGTSARYGNYAMDEMINTILSYGGKRERLEIKLFGGSKVIQSMADIGSSNINFVYDYLTIKQMTVTSQDVGGLHPRRVLYFPHTGRVLMCKLPLSLDKSVVQREMRYQGLAKLKSDSQ